jgi:2-keto-4-pentenoate hydratase
MKKRDIMTTLNLLVHKEDDMTEKIFTNEQLSKMIYDAMKNRTPIGIISQLDSAVTAQDAYDIQLKNVKRALEDGEIISGKKIGLTSKPMQELFGIDEPDYGHLYASTEIPNGGIVESNTLNKPKVEGEIAFVLKDDLVGPGVTVEDVYKATDYVCASIEIVDTRYSDWKIKLADTISDNGSSALYLLGDKKLKLDEISLTDIEMTLYKNGEVVNKGTGADVLGNPAVSVAWLANKLKEFGVQLNKGDVILSGAISAAPEAFSGDVFECVFSDMGSVKVEFK